ncbi:rhomboid family intramembrane serine protease [Lysinibacillus sp. NPDC097195]|uniref:rhomboid family intramembrane serine protease n=1 Tax=Lysinibacillus sp. NPDC097195 TaxID=3364141 RepID=UPI00380B509B
MINNGNLPIVSLVLAFLYISIFILDRLVFKGNLFLFGSGKSFNLMQQNEWYRILTGAFFHKNILHLLANVFGIYYVGLILEDKIGHLIFLIIYLIGNIGTYIIYSILISYTDGNGASPGIYALITCIIILHFKDSIVLNLNFKSYPVQFTIGYFIIGNFFNLGAFRVHLIGVVIGVILTFLFLVVGILL